LATDGKSESSLDLDAEWGETEAGSVAKGSDAVDNKKVSALRANTETK
jgi:hypothetical protein